MGAKIGKRNGKRGSRRGPSRGRDLPPSAQIASSMAKRIESYDKTLRWAWLLLALLVLGLTLAIRIRLLAIPLERDEGEYAYAGQLMLQGIPPYKLAYNMKFPGTYAAYAAIMFVFGQTIVGIHLGLLLVNAATIALIFFLGRRLVNSTAGIAAAASYAILSLSPSVLGLASHATHFVMLPVVAGVLLLLNQSNRPAFSRLFGSGLLFGLGLLMKQPAVFFVLFGAIYLLCKDARGRLALKAIVLRNLTFGAGVILPFGITCLLLWYAGVFSQFWFWTVEYAFQYGTLTSLSEGAGYLSDIGGRVIEAGWALWALAGFGLLAGLCSKRTRDSTGFILGLLACSVCALSQGLYFRQHYFILILPAISLLIGVAINQLSDLAAKYKTGVARFIPLLLLGAALGLAVFREKKIFFEASSFEVCRMSYDGNPFPEAIKIAEYLRAHTGPLDTIAVLGSEPEIYFYSGRHSATGYIYTYELMESQPYAAQMQREMAQEITAARPKYLLFVAVDPSWLRKPESERLIFNWLYEYAEQNYTLSGLVNMVTPDRTDYYLEQAPKSLPPRMVYSVMIYQRKF